MSAEERERNERLAERDLDCALHAKLHDCLWYADNEAWQRGGYHIYPHTTNKQVIVGTDGVPRYSSTGDGMLLVLEAMRGQRFSVRYRFAEELKRAVPGSKPGEYVEWPWALMHVTPDRVSLAALAALAALEPQE